MNLHRLALVAVLSLAAAALTYNAVSILSGDSGLTGMPPRLAP